MFDFDQWRSIWLSALKERYYVKKYLIIIYIYWISYAVKSKLSNFTQIQVRNMKVIHKNGILHFSEFLWGQTSWGSH